MTIDETDLAISILQPWAWCIVHNYKQIENWTWSTKVRGWVGIHAGKDFDVDGFEWIQSEFPHIRMPTRPRDFDRGGLVGRARITGCLSVAEGSAPQDPWFFGPYGFQLADAEPVPFQAMRGQLRFFKVCLNT